MNKREIHVFLTIFAVLILSCIPCIVNASNETSNHLLYRIENHTVVITGYNGDEKILTIPRQIDSYDVVCIDELAFAKNEKIWAVILPQTVTEIRGYAFHDSGIREIVLPQSLLRIGDGAFSNSHLTSIYLPPSVTEIGSAVFASCFNLRSVKIDGSIQRIPYRTFFENTCLYDVALPDTIEAIEEEAFYFCRELRFIDIPEGVSFIDDSAFYDCNELWDHPILKDYIGDYSDHDEYDEELCSD